MSFQIASSMCCMINAITSCIELALLSLDVSTLACMSLPPDDAPEPRARPLSRLEALRLEALVTIADTSAATTAGCRQDAVAIRVP
eukprot:3287385-Amphidinium_carterae.1